MVQKSGEKTSWGEGSFSHNLQGFSTIQPLVNHQQYFSKRHLNYKMGPRIQLGIEWVTEATGFFG